MAELHGEKIDIVDFSDDPAEFVANALSPARVTHVEVVDSDALEARVTVPDYQLSLAIGKEGQNARLAARLTGWRIDIRSDGVTTEPPVPRQQRGHGADHHGAEHHGADHRGSDHGADRRGADHSADTAADEAGATSAS